MAKRIGFVCLLFLFVSLCLRAEERSDGVVCGTVWWGNNLSRGLTVYLHTKGMQLQVKTDGNGFYSFKAPPGFYKLTAPPQWASDLQFSTREIRLNSGQTRIENFFFH